jgi:hypothetical protein
MINRVVIVVLLTKNPDLRDFIAKQGGLTNFYIKDTQAALQQGVWSGFDKLSPDIWGKITEDTDQYLVQEKLDLAREYDVSSFVPFMVIETSDGDKSLFVGGVKSQEKENVTIFENHEDGIEKLKNILNL